MHSNEVTVEDWPLHFEIPPNVKIKERVSQRSMGLLPNGKNEITHLVSLKKQSCTCREFREFRINMPKHHSARWCMHILKVLNSSEFFERKCEWNKAIFSSCNGYSSFHDAGPIKAWKINLPNDRMMVATVGVLAPEMDVYARKTRPGERSHEASGTIWRYRTKGHGMWDNSRGEPKGPPGARLVNRIYNQLKNECPEIPQDIARGYWDFGFE